MTTSRWALAALAALAGVVGVFFYATRTPDDKPAAPPAAVAALPLMLPAAPAQPAAASAALPAVQSTAPAPAAVQRVGSEGYGPHIERAFVGTDAADAWEAVKWLRLCASNEARRSSYEQARAVGVVPEVMTQLMREADDESRRCQTVTAQHQAMLAGLASRAMRARIPGAATTYAGAVVPGELTAEQRREVADAMRQEANAGAPSLLDAALSNRAWGLTDEERLSYLYAFTRLYDSHAGAGATVEALIKQGAVPFTAPPTPAQIAAAKLAGQQIIDLVRPDTKP
ncbi:hypothetical protein [Roseateles saccharophilus]|uniref:Uncharacterized protein n=1 Tax=Roseateles saccharophilus TaxID=304 RepID=A0A4R3V1N2_ROSSA|nr:hypothetical protein [Roseateles saccharophilus]MDG0835275.1 hypothetical protein [Roseateles saccharophilus]TCU96184.1 hypothetical protein EV671_101462 [Roseateles saccharophilus]